MTKELSPCTIDIIKNTSCLIVSNAEVITKSLYDIVFKRYPEIRNLFANAPINQSSLLADAISSYAVNIERIKILTPALEVIARTHVRKNIKPVHYSIIGMAFIDALELSLKEKASLEFLDAWREAFIYLSNILIGMEKNIIKKSEN